MIKLDDEHLMMVEPSNNCHRIENLEGLFFKTVVLEQRLRTSDMMTKGYHTCSCGETSDNLICKTPMGRETNSLLVHYVIHHSSDIPKDEWSKLEEEYQFILDNSL